MSTSQSKIQNPKSEILPIAGSIRVASGPWFLEEGWWLDDSRSGLSARSLPERAPVAARGVSQRGGASHCGSGSARGVKSADEPASGRAADQCASRSRVSGSDVGAPADSEQAKATDRDYWDVELSDGALYRIYRDRKSGTWFADGIYD